jgi:hypothetical protein
MSNFVLVTEVKSLVLPEIHASLKHESVIKFEFVYHLGHSVNFLQTAVQQSVFLQVTVEMRCHCELLVLHTTRLRPVVSCSHT